MMFDMMFDRKPGVFAGVLAAPLLACLLTCLLTGTLFHVPRIQAQDRSGAFLYAVDDIENDRSVYSVYAVDVDSGSRTKVGVVHDRGSDAGWSPDGGFIYLVDSEDSRRRTLTLVDSENGERRLVTDNLEPDYCALPVWWSPDGTWIVYLTDVDQHKTLNVLNIENAVIQNVPEIASEIFSLYWSADSRYFAYTTHNAPEGYWNVFVWGIQEQRVVLSWVSSAYPYLPSWSPAGHRLLYASHDLPDQIVVSGLTDEPSQHYPGDLDYANWSPDGRFLLVVQPEDNRQRSLNLIDVNARTETSVETQNFRGSSWSSDGRFILLREGMSDEDDSKEFAYVFDTLDNSRRRLTDTPLYVDRIDWSPTDHVLAFTASPGNTMDPTTELRIYDLDHAESRQFNRQIYIVGLDDPVQWSQDGHYLLVWTDKLELIHRDTWQIKSYADSLHPLSTVAWSPQRDLLLLVSAIPFGISLLDADDDSLDSIVDPPNTYIYFLGWRGETSGHIMDFCAFV